MQRSQQAQRLPNLISTGLAAMMLLATLSLSSLPARAQSVDSCMAARLADALTICQAILDSGSRNVDVYWKLSSAQYQDGQQALANKTLAEALRLHPGNAKLETLRDIISSDSTEQQLIARSAQLNQNSIDKGALKITCLTKTGEIAISACKRRLELTNVDGERMRSRLTELEEAQTATRIATAPSQPTTTTVPKPVEPVAVFVPVPTPSPTEPAQENVDVTNTALLDTSPSPEELALQERRAAYKELVAAVQTRLNNFGFNAGYPDGVPGNNTRNALSDFYSAINAPIITSISDLTLEDLNDAQIKLDIAKRQLSESQAALSQGNARLAVQKLNDAKASSGLLKVPADFERSIQASILASQNPVPEQPTQEPTAPNTVAAIKPVPTPAPNPVVVPSQTSTAANAPQNYASLMAQIKTLQGQIQRQQAEQSNQLDQLRSAL